MWVIEYAERGTRDPLGLAGTIDSSVTGRTAHVEITGSTATSIDAVIEDLDRGAVSLLVGGG